MEGDIAFRHMLVERGLEDWELIEEDCNKGKETEAKSSTKLSSVLRRFFVPTRHSPLQGKEQTMTEVEGVAERSYDVPTTSSSVTTDVPEDLEASTDVPEDLKASSPENTQIVSSTIPSCTDQDTGASFDSNTIIDIENEADHDAEENDESLTKRTEELLRSTRNWFLKLMEYTKWLISKISSFFRPFLRVSMNCGRIKRLWRTLRVSIGTKRL